MREESWGKGSKRGVQNADRERASPEREPPDEKDAEADGQRHVPLFGDMYLRERNDTKPKGSQSVTAVFAKCGNLSQRSTKNLES